MSKGKINHIFFIFSVSRSLSQYLWIVTCHSTNVYNRPSRNENLKKKNMSKYERWLKRKSCIFIDVAELFFIIFIFVFFALFLPNLESNGRNKPFNHLCDAVLLLLLLLCLGHQTVRGELNSFKCLLSCLSSLLWAFFSLSLLWCWIEIRIFKLNKRVKRRFLRWANGQYIHYSHCAIFDVIMQLCHVIHFRDGSFFCVMDK